MKKFKERFKKKSLLTPLYILPLVAINAYGSNYFIAAALAGLIFIYWTVLILNHKPIIKFSETSVFIREIEKRNIWGLELLGMSDSYTEINFSDIHEVNLSRTTMVLTDNSNQLYQILTSGLSENDYIEVCEICSDL